MPKDWLPNVSAKGIINPSTGGLTYLANNFIPFIVSLLMFAAVTLSLIFVVIGGIKWITSSGDKEGLAKARATITYAILGLVLALGSFMIIRALDIFLGVNLLGMPKTAYYIGP